MLSFLANSIINKYFTGLHCLLIFTDYYNVFKYEGKMPVVYYNLYNNTEEAEFYLAKQKCEGIIIAVSRPRTVLQKIEYGIKTTYVYRYNKRKYLVLPPNRSQENVEEIFNLTEIFYVTDMLVMREDNSYAECGSSFKINCSHEQDFSFLSHKYVGRNENLQMITINKWFANNKSYLNNNCLYPDKLNNQEGRPLRIASHNYQPYHITLDPLEESVGTETNLAKEYAKKHNMSIEFIMDEVGEWGAIYENWTGPGILGNLASDNADIGHAALYLQWLGEYYYLDFTKTFIRAGVPLLVPEPRLASGWSVPLFSFSSEMWIATALSFVICVLFILSASVVTQSMRNGVFTEAFSYLSLLEISIFESSALFLLQSVSKTKAMKRVYRFLSPLFIFSLFLSAAYSSGLASSMAVPRYVGAIKTVDDLAESGIHWGGTSDIWVFAIKNEDQPKYRKILSRFVVTSAEELERLSYTGAYGYVMERLPGGYFSISTFIKQDAIEHLRIMEEDLYWAYTVFMMKKSTPLLPSVNELISRVIETGIDAAWETVLFYTNNRIQNTARYYYYHGMDTGTVKLQWMHVQGAFGILIIGCVLSVFCFLTELLCYRYNTRLKDMCSQV